MSNNQTTAITLAKPHLSRPQIAAITICSILLGLAYYPILHDGISGLRLLLLNGILLSAITIVAPKFKKPFDPIARALAGSIGLISLFSIIWSSSLLSFLNTTTSMMLFVLLGYHLSDVKLRSLTPVDYLITWVGVFGFIPGFFSYANQAVKAIAPKQLKVSASKPVIRGLLLSAPVLALFAFIFSSADQQFANFFDVDWDINISTNLLNWAFWVSFVSVFFTGAFTYFGIHLKPFKPNKKVFTIGSTETLIVAGSTLAIFASFAILQLSNTLLVDTATATDQLAHAARRGFGELLFASMILFTLLLSLEKEKIKQIMTFRAIATGLVVSNFVILCSAFVRLLNYEQSFGFTLTRFLVHGFMIFMAVSMFALLAKILYKIKDQDFGLVMLGLSLAFVVGMNLANPDARITQSNLARDPAVTDIDYPYIESLSTDTFSVFNGTTLKDHPPLRDHICNQSEGFDSWLDWHNSEQQAATTSRNLCTTQ